MLIKIGYDIEFEVSAPTTLIYLLQVHPSRERDVQGGMENITLSPPLLTDFYIDDFDNHCARVHVDVGVSSVRLEPAYCGPLPEHHQS